jgi:hypothetical protein
MLGEIRPVLLFVMRWMRLGERTGWLYSVDIESRDVV